MHKQITISGFPVAYRLEGAQDAHCVVLVHGYAEDGRLWDAQTEHLKQRYRVLVPDLPGCGASGPLNEKGISLETCAEILAGILEKENIDAPTMIGHSMGGYITLAFMEKYPERLFAAGLFHSTALADTEEKKTMRRKCIEFIGKNGSAPFIRQSTPNLFAETTRSQSPEMITAMIDRYSSFDPVSLIAYYEAMIARPDRTNLLVVWKKPFLFIAGRQDNAVPLASLLPQTWQPSLSYVHILDEAGHLGMLEAPEASNRILDNFLLRNHIYHA